MFMCLCVYMFRRGGYHISTMVMGGDSDVTGDDRRTPELAV